MINRKKSKFQQNKNLVSSPRLIQDPMKILLVSWCRWKKSRG